MNADLSTVARSRFGTVGLDLGVVGRALRFIIGVAMTARVAHTMTTSDWGPSALGEVALYFAGTGLAYAAAYYVLRGRVLSRMSPWIGTALLLTPVLVILAADVGPIAFQLAVKLYVGVSLIIAAVMRYGGCEVIAFPILLFGGRYVVYCPYNLIDVVAGQAQRAMMQGATAAGARPPVAPL